MVQELSNDARDLLEDLELKGVLNDEKKVLSFCCACCRLIWDNLPKIARNALEIAEKYIEDKADVQDLENTRIALWNYLGDDSISFAKPNVAAIRAVICCLYETKTKDEAFDAIDYVMDFCNSVEIKSSEQYKLLSAIFNEP